MSRLRSAYNVVRSIVMTLIVLLVVVYLGLYVVLSLPLVQMRVKERISKEASEFLGGNLQVGSLTFHPFSEIILTEVALDSPSGERCAEIRKVAAGIDLWSLFSDGKIVLNYAEIIGLDAGIVQQDPHGQLNLQFLIEALSPKDKTKPSSRFDLRIRNVVVRDSRASYTRPWLKQEDGSAGKWANIGIHGLRMDLSIPTLRNDLFKFDVRNIRFDSDPGISVRSLSAHVAYIKDTVKNVSDRIEIKDFKVAFPNSHLTLGDLNLRLDSLTDIKAEAGGSVTPSDFSSILPQLKAFDTAWSLDLDGILKGKSIAVETLAMHNEATGSTVDFRGKAMDFGRKDSLDFTVDHLKIDISPKDISEIAGVLPGVNEKVRTVLRELGHLEGELAGSIEASDRGKAKGFLKTSAGMIDFDASATGLRSKRPHILLKAEGEEIRLDRLLATDKVGSVSAVVEAEVEGIGRDAEGHISVVADRSVVMGRMLTDFALDVRKEKDSIDLTLDASTGGMTMNIGGNAVISDRTAVIDAEADFTGIVPSEFGVKGSLADCRLSGHLSANTQGKSIDTLTGKLDMRNVVAERRDGKRLELSGLSLIIDTLSGDRRWGSPESLNRDIRLECDWLEAGVRGSIHPGTLGPELKWMAASVFPTLIAGSRVLNARPKAENDFEFEINIKGTQEPYEFLNAPVRPLTDVPIRGSIDANQGKATVTVATPHMQQGRNKLIRDVRLDLDVDATLGMAKMNAGLIFPAKKGDAQLAVDVFGVNDRLNVNLDLNPTMESVVKGGIAMAATFSRIADPIKPQGQLAVSLDILPSSVIVNDMTWMIADGGIDYTGKRIMIRNFLISHDEQYVKIDGSASESAEDVVNISLKDIDLDYIFGILNINYVSFGGMASGKVVGSRLLSKRPEARTETFHVKGLSYNGAVLGDSDLASEYEAAEQKVGIYAVVRDNLTRERRASIEGGIWVTRDSLSFGFDADKVNVGIMKPFVSAFCSDLYGSASGQCRLYGTFSDIDLVGGLKADTLSMKLDFTNTWYHAGGDSVYLQKGMIEIPPLTLYDDELHTAEFSGWLRHRYFHEPVFSFRLKDARTLLCYDTNEKINPLWYGTIYGTGHAQINGAPGLIEIDMNMTTEENTKFYYIISDAEDVTETSFLSFTDRRKEKMATATKDTEPDYLRQFRKHSQEMEQGTSNVILQIKGTVTNDALVTLVMDPKAGDNITARGQGALQMDYNLASNDLRMIGTYVLDEGNYNFTLQDIIIKNFNIRKGSMIKFDGDPMKANLDIAATYRVNTNLTDLDKSFSTDRELNRTNVPVDAVLQVDGPMTNPDITFDLELPSLTSDVERKVKSIVSTNDMMSRQIIYLLALNRFYTPEYTNGETTAGSEWSSMASSTISSQLSNILSQMTDKLDVAPSFRTDKGNFSDMEFDLALSSRLLNNRLLINGNFGYRDKNTSNTQFVGDFDIEYLLSKNGNLRLKAYNHFNDQNYYLRSALTTQGVGVVFRRDFDRLFRRKKEEPPAEEGEAADSIRQIREEGPEPGLEQRRDSTER